jgi:hypothetical protein
MLAFVLMRCALLLTIAAPEARYTLECFPMVIALAAIALSGKASRQSVKKRSVSQFIPEPK